MGILWWKKRETTTTTIISAGARIILPFRLAYRMVAASRALGGYESMFLLKIIQDGKNFKIRGVEIPKQRVNPGSCMLDLSFFKQFFKKKEGEKWEGHWAHSHAEMGVFFSSLDEKTIKAILNWLKLYQKAPYIVSIVFNNRGEFLGKISALLSTNEILDIFVDVIIEIDFDIEDKIKVKDEIEKEITEKVRRSYFPFQPGVFQIFNQHQVSQEGGDRKDAGNEN